MTALPTANLATSRQAFSLTSHQIQPGEQLFFFDDRARPSITTHKSVPSVFPSVSAFFDGGVQPGRRYLLPASTSHLSRGRPQVSSRLHVCRTNLALTMPTAQGWQGEETKMLTTVTTAPLRLAWHIPIHSAPQHYHTQGPISVPEINILRQLLLSGGPRNIIILGRRPIREVAYEGSLYRPFRMSLLDSRRHPGWRRTNIPTGLRKALSHH